MTESSGNTESSGRAEQAGRPELNSKQKSYLRGLGQKTPVGAAIGKAGMTDAVVKEISTLLDRHELLKVRMPADDPADRKAQGELLAEATKSAIAGALGRTVLLYRPNPALDYEKRMHLP